MDRGWAIVQSDWYDRIDIWVGEWDDWLHRAKSIGMRRVVWWKCPEDATYKLGFNWDVIPNYKDFTTIAFWSLNQHIGRSWVLVTTLQNYLKQLGYVDNNIIIGIYNEQMRQLVCRFQIDQLWLGGDEDYCGVFGPQTRSLLKKTLIQSRIISNTSIYQIINTSRLSLLFTQPNVRPDWNYERDITIATLTIPTTVASTTIVSNSTIIDLPDTRDIVFTVPIELGERSDHVIALQKILVREWLLNRDMITWFFWTITEQAVAQLQIKYTLINSISHPAAWHLGPATRALLNKKQQPVWRIMRPLDA